MSAREIPTYHDELPALSQQLAERGALGLITIDASAFAHVEYEYGTSAWEEVRQRLFEALFEQRGKDFRQADLICVDAPLSLRFLVFLDRKRRKDVPLGPADLRIMRRRLVNSVIPHVARAGFPYHQGPATIDVGFGMAVQNDLVHPERLVGRALREALGLALHLRRAEELERLERIQDLIVRERVITAYQPIMSLADRAILGHEALSRGARGTGLETADQLFGAATEHHLLVELDRLCRKRAMLNSARIPRTSRIFVNTLPATIRDPQFRGKALISFLDAAQLAPARIVIEITEKLVIENYGLFRETMVYFTDLGMSFAVDDVGAGYSGLEAIARLKPAFLKIDMSLVRDVHISVVNREMVKAIVALGEGIGSAVIAEGIQTKEEADTLREIGATYGQGYYLARPSVPE